MAARILDLALALTVLTLGLAACVPPQSYERLSNGSIIHLDRLSAAQKAAARRRIAQRLMRGVAAYRLGVGDEVEVIFHVNRRATARRYSIAPDDKLHIGFLGDAENSETVQVLPDGRLSLPLIGPVVAAGKTTDGLARQLQERYSRFFSDPKITVNVIESHSALDDFLGMLGSKSRKLVVTVLPDGTIALPLLRPLRARGRTMREFARKIDAAYSAKGLPVAASVLPSKLRANAALVIGEVGKPGRIELRRPTTVSMAVAQAGGVNPSGAEDAVRVFYIGADGAPRVRSINLDEVMNGFRLEDDMIVRPNSIIYVPPTALAKAGNFMDSFMRKILRFNGFSISGIYNIQ